MRQFDVTTAFLNGTTNEKVYIHPPRGLDVGPNIALKLMKGLYGLKQSPRVWSNEFRETVEKLGFRAAFSDNCVFKHQVKSIHLCVYVNDGIVIASDETETEDLISKLKESYDMREATNISFVGHEFVKSSSSFIIH